MSESLRSRFESDLKTAMKAGDVATRETIRFLLSALKYAEIDKGAGGSLDGTEEIALLQRQAKRMVESIEQFDAGKRPDLAEKERVQLAILKRYLPAEMSDDELTELARVVAAEVGATTAKDLGRMMPIMIERAAGRADGKRLSTAARAALG